MARLDGRVAILTGGAKGIGKHYARALAAEAARLMIAMTRSHVATSISVHFVSCSGANSAALLTRMSILPKRSMVLATSAATAPSSLTSVTELSTELAP